MKIKVFDTLDDACLEAASKIALQLKEKPNSNLGLATGRTPIKLYEKLAELHNMGLSFKRATTFNLDEYLGLSEDHPDSYRNYMNKNLFNKIDIDINNTFIPPCMIEDNGCTLKSYDDLIIEKGGIDIQILGIGINGHIGFNEPNEYFKLYTHLTNLAEDTIKANKATVVKEMPTRAITMGIKSIFNAKNIIIIASGEEKGHIIKKALSGIITPKIPLSILSLHPNTTLYVDRSANSVLINTPEKSHC